VESIIYNAFGDETRIRFLNIKFNQGIDPSLFDFVIPEDAEVLQLTPGTP
jgi:outer membrane lipoprotein-sorting protein